MPMAGLVDFICEFGRAYLVHCSHMEKYVHPDFGRKISPIMGPYGETAYNAS